MYLTRMIAANWYAIGVNHWIFHVEIGHRIDENVGLRSSTDGASLLCGDVDSRRMFHQDRVDEGCKLNDPVRIAL